MFKTSQEILNDMLASYKQVTGIDVNPNDLGDEVVIKSLPYANVMSVFYAKLEMVKDARHPNSSNPSDLVKHLASRFLPVRRQPSQSQGQIGFVSKDNFQNILFPIGVRVIRSSTGEVYISTQEGLSDNTGNVTILFRSERSGQALNIDKIDEIFSVEGDLAGYDKEGSSITVFADGRDLESPTEMLERINEYDRKLNTGGNLPAYEQFAKDADPSVVTATAIKHPRGVSTVDVVITSGTTDIEGAVRANLPVVRIPSLDLIATVQTYVSTQKPTTDDFLTRGPTEAEFDTTISYRPESQDDIPFIEEEIRKLWEIFVYSAKSGSRIEPTELERRIDQSLGARVPYRRVSDFTVDNYYKDISDENILKPGILTLSEV